MSTTDTRAAFEAWARGIAQFVTLKGAAPQGKPWYYFDDEAQDAWEVWQAATEAAKATCTAGELPPLPEAWITDCTTKDPAARLHFAADQMRAYGQACAEAARQPAPALPVGEICSTCGDNVIITRLLDESSEAARQPAPVVARDDREEFEAWAADPRRSEKLPLDRWPKNDAYKDTRTYVAYYGWKSGREILRAALAATAAPVELSYLQLLAIANDSEAHEALQGFSEDPTQDNGVCVVRAILAATNRSQP